MYCQSIWQPMESVYAGSDSRRVGSDSAITSVALSPTVAPWEGGDAISGKGEQHWASAPSPSTAHLDTRMDGLIPVAGASQVTAWSVIDNRRRGCCLGSHRPPPLPPALPTLTRRRGHRRPLPAGPADIGRGGGRHGGDGSGGGGNSDGGGGGADARGGADCRARLVPRVPSSHGTVATAREDRLVGREGVAAAGVAAAATGVAAAAATGSVAAPAASDAAAEVSHAASVEWLLLASLLPHSCSYAYAVAHGRLVSSPRPPRRPSPAASAGPPSMVVAAHPPTTAPAAASSDATTSAAATRDATTAAG